MVQFTLRIRKAKEAKYGKSQDIKISDAKKTSKYMILKGKKQTANPKTIAMAIFKTFRFFAGVARPQYWPIVRLESSAT